MKAKTRDRLLAGTALAVALSLSGFTVTRLAADPGTAVETIPAAATQARAAGEFRVQLLGDTMMGDASVALIDSAGHDALTSRLGGFVDGDYTIVNLETPITERTVPELPKGYNYRAHPDSLAALRRAGVDAVGLGNNHSMDFGRPGLSDTLAAAQAHSLATFGAGTDIDAARRPLLIESPQGRVAVVNFTENFGDAATATPTMPGTLVLSAEEVQRGVIDARAAGADLVIAVLHWGDNYAPVQDQQRYWAHALAAAGYDLVVGSGPHIAQEIELIGDTPVAYSLGNFVFGSPGRFRAFGAQGFGLSLTAVVVDKEIDRLEVTCLRTDNEKVRFKPRPCKPRQSQKLLPTLNPGILLVGDRAVLELNGP